MIIVRLIYAFVGSLCTVSDRRRGLGSHSLGKFCRVIGLITVYINIVIVVDALLSGDPVTVLAKLKTNTTVLVLIFRSAVGKLMTNMRLATGSVLHPNS